MISSFHTCIMAQDCQLCINGQGYYTIIIGERRRPFGGFRTENGGVWRVKRKESAMREAK